MHEATPPPSTASPSMDPLPAPPQPSTVTIGKIAWPNLIIPTKVSRSATKMQNLIDQLAWLTKLAVQLRVSTTVLENWT